MASIKYTNAKCGQCHFWKVSRNPLGTCRVDPDYQATIGRYAKACGVFEAELVMTPAPPEKEHPLKFYRR